METSCGCKQAEIIQLAAKTKEGRSFSTFTTLTKKKILLMLLGLTISKYLGLEGRSGGKIQKQLLFRKCL